MDAGPDRAASMVQVVGREHPFTADHRMTLLDALRNELDSPAQERLRSRMNACLLLTVAVVGRRVTTVEDLADGRRVHPVQQPRGGFDRVA